MALRATPLEDVCPVRAVHVSASRAKTLHSIGFLAVIRSGNSAMTATALFVAIHVADTRRRGSATFEVRHYSDPPKDNSQFSRPTYSYQVAVPVRIVRPLRRRGKPKRPQPQPSSSTPLAISRSVYHRNDRSDCPPQCGSLQALVAGPPRVLAPERQPIRRALHPGRPAVEDMRVDHGRAHILVPE